MGLTKKDIQATEDAIAFFSKIGKKEGWLKQKDVDKAKHAIKVMKGGKRKAKKTRNRRGGRGLGEPCKSDESCDGDLVCGADETCVQPPSVGEVASMLQTASDNAGIPRDLQINGTQIPSRGGSNPYANERGAQMVNNTLNHTQQLIQHAAGRNDNDITAMVIQSGNTEMLSMILARQERREQREHEYRLQQLAAQKQVVEDIVQKNQEVSLDQNRTQLALYNASQRTNRMNTNLHLVLQAIILATVFAVAILAYNAGDVFADMFRNIDTGARNMANITVPTMDAENASWWQAGLPHLINMLSAILQGGVDLVGFFVTSLTQFLAALATLGPAGMAMGVLFLGILFMITVYQLMNIRRVRGLVGVVGLDIATGEQQGAQALPQLGPAVQQNPGLFLGNGNVADRVDNMIRNGNGRLTNGEETLMLGNAGESAASGSQGSSSQLRLRNRSSGNGDGSNSKGSQGGRRRTRRRRRKNKKTKRKQRRRRRKSKRRRRRKSRR